HRAADQVRRVRVRLQGNRAGQRIGSDQHGPAIRKVGTEAELAQIIEPRRSNKRIRPKAGDRGTEEGITRGNDLVHDAVSYTEDAGATRHEVGGKDHLAVIVDRGPADEAAITTGRVDDGREMAAIPCYDGSASRREVR